MPDRPTVRTRFAPSPTGYLHVGGARTALFNWLFARAHGGTFVLRIEDTDAARNTEAARDAIFSGLRWLGIEWDEGPEVGGDAGPYFQSERKAIYDRYCDRLQADGCLYDDAGALRFRSPGTPRTIHDKICGDVPADRSKEPDMTIRRPDGSYIFHFVNVVDDIEMGITHVIRGEDHLLNTAKHLELYEALRAAPPVFAHIPLILNTDGSKMSKRDVGAAMATYPAEGFLPEAVRNYLCLLGWSPKDDREKLTIGEVMALFDFEHLNHSNARFDIEKCQWLNGEYVKALSPSDFAGAALPHLSAAGIACDDRTYLEAILTPIQEKITLLAEVPKWIAYLFDEAYPFDPEAAGKAFGKPGAIALLAALRPALEDTDGWEGETLSAAIQATATANGAKPGALMFPLRVALSGQSFGPGVTEMMIALGRQRTLARLDRTIAEFTSEP